MRSIQNLVLFLKALVFTFILGLIVMHVLMLLFYP